MEAQGCGGRRSLAGAGAGAGAGVGVGAPVPALALPACISPGLFPPVKTGMTVTPPSEACARVKPVTHR